MNRKDGQPRKVREGTYWGAAQKIIKTGIPEVDSAPPTLAASSTGRRYETTTRAEACCLALINMGGLPLLVQPIWEKQPNEPPEGYRWFIVFMQAGVRRSISGIYKLYADDWDKVKKSTRNPQSKRAGCPPTWWYMMAKAFKWTERTEAFDLAVAEEAAKEIKDLVQRTSVNRVKALSELVTAGRTIVAKADLENITERGARDMFRHAVSAIDVGTRGHRVESGGAETRVDTTGESSVKIDIKDDEGAISNAAAILGILAECGAIPAGTGKNAPTEDDAVHPAPADS